MTTLTTTFNRLKRAGACGQQYGSQQGYDKLAQHLGGVTSYGKNTPISLSVIAQSNGLNDALWCLQATGQDFETVVHPWLKNYLADVLDHLCQSRLPSETKGLLQEGVGLLREPTTSREQFQAYANKVWVVAGAAEDARAAAWVAAWAAEAAAWAAAGAAERQWQLERFIRLVTPQIRAAEAEQ